MTINLPWMRWSIVACYCWTSWISLALGFVLPSGGDFVNNQDFPRRRRCGARILSSSLGATPVLSREDDSFFPLDPKDNDDDKLTTAIGDWDSQCTTYRPLQILYQDDNLLAIHKPAGIPHHNEPAPMNDNLPGIITVARHQIQQGSLCVTQKNDDDDVRLYGVHRLDKVTSGILLLAKNAATARVLTQALARHDLVKYYTGLSFAKPKKKKQGWVQGWLYRGRRKSWMLSTQKTKSKSAEHQQSDKNAANHKTRQSAAQKQQEGLFCKTRFFTAGLGHLSPSNVLLRSCDNSNDDVVVPPKTLLWFRPYTGRTHQLRVTAKSLGLPLAGDPIYATTTLNGMPRTCLHATALVIPAHVLEALPFRGESSPGNGSSSSTWAFDEDGGITIWSTPPFGVYYDSDASSSSSWNKTMSGLIDKHCQEFPELQRLSQRALADPPRLFDKQNS